MVKARVTLNTLYRAATRRARDSNPSVSRRFKFFGGVPGQILEAWFDRRFELVISPQITDEYFRVAEIVRARYAEGDAEPILVLLAQNSVLVDVIPLAETVCRDPDDDKFLACALAAGGALVVSGDGGLRAVSGYRGRDTQRICR